MRDHPDLVVTEVVVVVVMIEAGVTMVVGVEGEGEGLRFVTSKFTGCWPDKKNINNLTLLVAAFVPSLRKLAGIRENG